jgi:hypothetical protein
MINWRNVATFFSRIKIPLTAVSIFYYLVFYRHIFANDNCIYLVSTEAPFPQELHLF